VEADEMLKDQGGSCAICRAAPAAHVDHDHETGAVRALLCFNCNGGLGQFRDDPAVLRAAADYVERHAQRQQRTQPLCSPLSPVTARAVAPRRSVPAWLLRRPELLCDRIRAEIPELGDEP
jgi:hypothetical protein